MNWLGSGGKFGIDIFSIGSVRLRTCKRSKVTAPDWSLGEATLALKARPTLAMAPLKPTLNHTSLV